MLLRPPVLPALLVACLAAACAAPSRQIVTPEEAAAGRSTAGPPRAYYSVDPDAPVIEVVEPREGPALTAPVTIRLRFRAQAGATINPATFRANYGALGLDITGRLLQYARVDANGMVLEGVAIPAGSHRITLRIADTAGRAGERTFRFTVTE